MILTTPNNRFLQRVNPQITRALADSGSSLNHSEIQKIGRQIADLGLWSNLKFWVHNGLVKTRDSGGVTYVTKGYDVSSDNLDVAQSTTTVQPKLNTYGFEFDGTNDMLGTSTLPDILVNATKSWLAWVKIINIPSNYFANAFAIRYSTDRVGYTIRWYSWSGSHYLYISRDRAGVAEDFITVEISSFPTDYMMITGVYDAANLKLYVNSSFINEATTATTNGTVAGTGGTWIGRDGGTGNSSNSVFNNIMIFNSALSSSQITSIFNATKSFYGVS
jgi:hypothetical protein